MFMKPKAPSLHLFFDSITVKLKWVSTDGSLKHYG